MRAIVQRHKYEYNIRHYPFDIDEPNTVYYNTDRESRGAVENSKRQLVFLIRHES